MVAIALGLILIGYSIGLYGYILIRGYDISVVQMFSKSWPPGAVAGYTYNGNGIL